MRTTEAQTLSHPKSWQQTARITEEFRSQRPVLQTTDGDHLLTLAAQEVDEAEEAHHLLESSLLFNFFDQATEHAKEIADVLVFLYSYSRHQKHQLAFEDAWHRANGQGAKSPIYDQLYDQALNLSEGDVDANLDHFLTYVMSLSKHLPYAFSVTDAIEATLKKNFANRPEEYYQMQDRFGRPFTPDEIAAKQKHTEAALRLLRNHYGSPLQTWMHEFHRVRILDFANSELNLALIQETIQEQEGLMAIGLNQLLRKTPLEKPAQPTVLFRQLELAGAVPLTYPAQ